MNDTLKDRARALRLHGLAANWDEVGDHHWPAPSATAATPPAPRVEPNRPRRRKPGNLSTIPVATAPLTTVPPPTTPKRGK